MALTIDDVRKIATLARLRLSAGQEAMFAGQLGHVVEYIDQLQAFQVGEAGAAVDGDSREAADRTVPCLGREAFLRNAPQTLGAYLVVPAVKGGGGDDGLG